MIRGWPRCVLYGAFFSCWIPTNLFETVGRFQSVNNGLGTQQYLWRHYNLQTNIDCIAHDGVSESSRDDPKPRSRRLGRECPVISVIFDATTVSGAIRHLFVCVPVKICENSE